MSNSGQRKPSPPGESSSSCRVYVGNLSYDVTWMELKDLMRRVGRVKNVTVLTDTQTGRSRGCAVVEFTRPAEAHRAIAELTDIELKGRKIFVREDRESMKRSSPPDAERRIIQQGPMAITAPPPSGGSGRYNPSRRTQRQSLAVAAPSPNSPLDSPPTAPNGGRMRAAIRTNRVVIVSNLPEVFEWQEVKDIFKDIGKVHRADIIRGTDGIHTGNAVVEFRDSEGALAAISIVHDILTVRLAVENDPVFHAGRGRRLYVGQLDYSVEWQDLKDHFKPMGVVLRCDIPRDLNGRSKGYGIVEFQEAACAQRAMVELNDTMLHNRRIHVREDREER